MAMPHAQCENRMASLALGWYAKTIDIPADLRNRPLEALPGGRTVSTRLAHVLHRSGLHVLGDLHGRRVGDFARKRNCGLKTLRELDSLASAVASRPLSRDRRTTVSRKSGETAFAVPKSVCGFRFDELPITKHLANVARSNGLRTLGDLQGRTLFDLLRYKACGWRTVVEVQQLLERAIAGEFDLARIDASNTVAELLTLLEQGIAKLAPRDRQFLLARIRGMTFEEIGQRYGFTRARVHQLVVRALGTLSKTWGPRVTHLLEIVKRRCFSLSSASELTPGLLEQWVGGSSRTFRLTRKAHVRLIAALDKDVLRRQG
jgi:Sigma-70, region 4